MKKRLITLVVFVVVLLMATTSANAITFGVPDNGAHPYVGTLYFKQSSGWYSCSGTLIAPRVVLTAGHCTEEGGVTNEVTYVRFAEDALSGLENYSSAAKFLKKEWIQGQAIPHPQYDDFAEWPLTYDVGVVLLRKPVYMDTYGTLPPERFLETSVGPKDTYTAVGYGMQGYIRPFYMDVWARYKGTVSLIELNSTWAGGASAKFTNNPGGGNGSGGTCFGDSGGPIFYGNSNMVVAVVSWGNTPCIGVDFQFRVDTATALNFVRQYVP
jgi:hypothetical protein